MSGVVGSKVEAARVLASAGWNKDKIASAVAASADDVERWLDPRYVATTTRRSGNSACAVCGASEQRLRNNGMCPTCTADRHAAIELMREHGATWREINEAFGITGARGMLLARERTR